ncbi:MAG TPA: efflux RND transporter periplasmic adaptor subunit [Acetobacteraceae bacterium]|nr:efflux RND transporter periplasmic adaptor subunit [Acetobacteraceae bacterium]
MRTRTLILGLCIVAGAGAIVAWHTTHAAAAAVPPAEPPPVPVVAEKVRVSDMPIVLTGIGTVTAYNIVAMNAQVIGTIDKIGFIEGQTVHPGSLIAQLDPRPFQATLQQAEAALARDTANLVATRADLGRYAALEKRGFAAQQQVTDQAATVNELQAAIAGDKASIFSAQTQLSYTTITAPINGVTGIQNVDIGNIVQPSSTTPIVTITQIQPISVIFTVPQDDVPKVQSAMAKGRLPAIAYAQNDHTKLDTGALLLVNNTVNQASGTIQLKATFPNADRTLWPGEFVNVQLILSERHDAINVPLDALQQGANGTFVYVIDTNGTARQRAVTIGETLRGRALIDTGLQPGDIVVTLGQYRLTDGVHVIQVSAGDPSVQNSTEASAGMLE